MCRNQQLDRRSFLKAAGATAALGAAGASGALGERGLLAEPALGSRGRPDSQTHDFDEVYDRVGTGCIKWDRTREEFGEDLEVAMGIADQDFRAAPCVTRALAERCEHENWGYLDVPESYVQAVVDWNERRYGLEIDPDSIVLNSGVHDGLVSALRTFAPPGSRVLMTTPVYGGFYGDIRFTRTVPEESPMRLVDGRYEVDFDDFERRARRAHAFILCNPQNPTGNCWSAEELTRMGEICLEHRVVVLADEIHCDFVTEGQTYTPFASLPDRDIVDNSLTFKSASKSFSLSAMKTAWCFSTNRDYLERIRSNTRTDLNTLGLVATEAALTDGDDWLDALVAYIDRNHEFTEAYVREHVPLVRYGKAEGTYLAWLDVGDAIEAIGAEETAARESRSSGREVTPEGVLERWLADSARVHLNPGSSYGEGGAGRMRMNLATSRTLIRRALENMTAALERV